MILLYCCAHFSLCLLFLLKKICDFNKTSETQKRALLSSIFLPTKDSHKLIFDAFLRIRLLIMGVCMSFQETHIHIRNLPILAFNFPFSLKEKICPVTSSPKLSSPGHELYTVDLSSIWLTWFQQNRSYNWKEGGGYKISRMDSRR